MIKKLLGLAAVLATMFAAVPASATMIYGFVGAFSGTLTTHLSTTPVPHSFTDLDLAFIGESDGTAATLDSGLTALLGANVYSYSLAALLVTDGSNLDMLSGFSFVVAPTKKLIGFEGPQGLLFAVKLPDAYDGTSFYAPSGFSDIKASQAITFGNDKLKLTHVTDSTGGAFFAFDAPVPESATWAMFILGFGAVGFGLRRRKPADHRLTA